MCGRGCVCGEWSGAFPGAARVSVCVCVESGVVPFLEQLG